MVDNVNSVGSGRPSQVQNSPAAPSRDTANEGENQVQKAGQVPQAVDVELSDAVKQAEEKAAFDEVKVRQLKQAIESGNYPLDSRKMAESFLELERLL